MDSEERTVTVRISPDADADLMDIWNFNSERYGVDHADEYLDFLISGIEQLAADFAQHPVIDLLPNYQYKTLRKGPRGHGHQVIYRLDSDRMLVKVLHIFHTSMDVEGRMDE